MAGWESELLSYLSRADVKAEMRSYVSSARRGGGISEDEAHARSIVENRIIPQIEALVNARVPSMGTGIFLPVQHPSVTPAGEYSFELYFDPEAVKRDSLYAKGEGLNDVLAYLSKGSKAIKHWVSGYHFSKAKIPEKLYIPAGYHRSPDPFLTDAVNLINRNYAGEGITVTLGSKY